MTDRARLAAATRLEAVLARWPACPGPWRVNWLDGGPRDFVPICTKEIRCY